MYVALGTVLREARCAAKMTLRQLAKLIGCQPSYLSEIENGLRPIPKDDTFLTKISEVLNLKTSDTLLQATKDREYKDPKRLIKLFRQNNELAINFYRMSSEYSSDEELINFLNRLFSEHASKEDEECTRMYP